MTKIDKTRINLHDVFEGLQDQMRSKLQLNRRTLKHPVAKGDASELEWIDLLSNYLPTRYRVEKAFVIDHRGTISQQLDIVIFDRHYSPFLFHQNGQKYIPAESVYAVIEVKQALSGDFLSYAGKKANSVRKLVRTRGTIIGQGGKPIPPRELTHIFAGIVTLDGMLTKKQEKQLLSMDDNSLLDIGCSLERGAFFIDWQQKTIERCSKDKSLVYFFLKLLAGLQSQGTVGPLDIGQYCRYL